MKPIYKVCLNTFIVVLVSYIFFSGCVITFKISFGHEIHLQDFLYSVFPSYISGVIAFFIFRDGELTMLK